MGNRRGKSATQIKLEAEVGAVLSSPDGRDFMWRLLSAAGVYQANDPKGGDALGMAYREGARSMGLMLTTLLLQQPTLYQLMWNENVPELSSDGAEYAKDEEPDA